MRMIWKILLVLGVGVAHPAMAQTINTLNPPGGLTIKDVVAENDGWALVTFQESLPELSGCQTVNWGGVIYTNPLWLELSGTYMNQQGAKLVYGTALAAYLTGKKVVGADWRQISYWCDLYRLRLGP